MVEAHLGPRVLGVPALSWAEIELKAKRLMSQACPECLKTPQPTPVAALYEGGLEKVLGITYGVEELLGSEAHFDPETGELILSKETYLGLLEGRGRDRFTVAHEIGHVVLHRPYYQTIKRDRRQPILLCRSKMKPFQDPERQTDVFASEFLIPTHLAVHLLREGASEEDFKRIFQVSFDAAQVKIGRILRRQKKERPF